MKYETAAKTEKQKSLEISDLKSQLEVALTKIEELLIMKD
jgi:hypothetical protein